MEWLSDQQQAAWRPLVALLLRLPAVLDAELQKDAGITHFDYLVLSGLSEAPNRTLRMSELAATASSSLSRLSHVVSRLEAKGWVRREPCPGDGRFINAVLTDDGMRKVEATAPGHVTAVRELLLDTLTPEEFAQLGALSAKILAAQGLYPDWLGQGPERTAAAEDRDSGRRHSAASRALELMPAKRPGTTRPDS